MIKYYLIHCLEHVDREKHIESQKKYLGKPIKIFTGINTKNIKLEDQIEYIDNFDKNIKFNENHNFRFYLPGQIGCYLSHFKLIEKIMIENQNNIDVSDYSVIFEDDVRFKPNLNDKIKKNNK
jgi:GR25 family glycosyltransferase involved in LPS biosynthesis